MTRKLTYEPGKVLLREEIWLEFPHLKHFMRLRFFIHYQNQLIRSFGSSSIPDAGALEINAQNEYLNDSNFVEVAINSIQILTRRPDAKQQCNNELYDDDTQWMQTASKTVGCIPIYWKRFSQIWKDEQGLEYCKRYEQYKQTSDHIGNRWKILTEYEPPCQEMTTINNAYDYV